MTVPKPIRDESVETTFRRHDTPNTGPWDRNQGLFHMDRARRHRRVTLIIRNGFPLEENSLVFNHHCRGLMYRRPKGITLDAAAMSPSSLWNCFTVIAWPSFILETFARMDSIWAGDNCARIVVESHTTPRNMVLWAGDNTLFSVLSLNPKLRMWPRTTSRCRTAISWDWASISQSSI